MSLAKGLVQIVTEKCANLIKSHQTENHFTFTSNFQKTPRIDLDK